MVVAGYVAQVSCDIVGHDELDVEASAEFCGRGGGGFAGGGFAILW